MVIKNPGDPEIWKLTADGAGGPVPHPYQHRPFKPASAAAMPRRGDVRLNCSGAFGGAISNLSERALAEEATKVSRYRGWP